ncbi:MAG: hypothetical protein ACOCVF_01690 [bacterium]
MKKINEIIKEELNNYIQEQGVETEVSDMLVKAVQEKVTSGEFSREFKEQMTQSFQDLPQKISDEVTNKVIELLPQIMMNLFK